MGFYGKTLQSLISAGQLNPAASTLVVAGGETDREALTIAGFLNVTISNLDIRLTGNEFAPFDWSFEDAESLSYPDRHFEQVIVHAGLHHCASPHRALTEMYRVAARSVLAFEARDSLVMRAGKLFGLTADHEIEAIVANRYAFGGWRNTALPNYVYRWTEREVEKAIASYDPSGPSSIRYFYGLRLPTERLAMGSAAKRVAGQMLALPIRIVFRVARRQGNEFAFFIERPSSLHPWNNSDLSPNRKWLDPRYRSPG